MRKLLLSIVISAAAWSSHGQTLPAGSWSGFYVGANVGYNWPHAGGVNGAGAPAAGTGAFNSVSSLQSFDYSKGSYGTGVGVNLNLGYMLNEHLGLDLQVGTIFGKKNTFEYTQTAASGVIRETFTTQSRMPWYVAPSVLVSTGATRPLSLYGRMGIVLPFGGDLLEEYMRENDIIDVDDLTDEEYDFFMSKGLIGAVGVNYRLSPALSIYGEARGMSLTRYVKSSELTAATSNGVNTLDLYDIDQKQFEYSASYTYDPVTQTVTRPSLRTSIGLPYSNFGINVGAVYNFNAAPVGDPYDTTWVPNPTGPYARFGFGYNLPHGGNYHVGDGFGRNPISGSETYNTGSNTTIVDINKASYGSGLGITVAGGYMFNPYFGAELGISVNLPKQQTFEYDEIDTMGATLFTDNIFSRPKTSVFITPALVFSTGAHKPLSIYTRAGLVLPVGGDLVVNGTSTDHITNAVTETEERYKFGMSKGLSGALGMRFALSQTFGFMVEVSGTSLTRYTKTSEVTGYTVNGADQLGTLLNSQKMTEYHFNTSFDPASTSTVDPNTAPAISLPYSTWGVNLGVDLRF